MEYHWGSRTIHCSIPSTSCKLQATKALQNQASEKLRSLHSTHLRQSISYTNLQHCTPTSLSRAITCYIFSQPDWSVEITLPLSGFRFPWQQNYRSLIPRKINILSPNRSYKCSEINFLPFIFINTAVSAFLKSIDLLWRSNFWFVFKLFPEEAKLPYTWRIKKNGSIAFKTTVICISETWFCHVNCG